MTKYQKPTGQCIGDGATKLYKLEQQRNDIIKDCAREQGRILGYDASAFWTHSLPEQLLSVLGAFDRPAAILAAQAFLERNQPTSPAA